MNIPVEMAEFALREDFVSEAGIYLASQFLYSGQAPTNQETVSNIGKACGLKSSSIYEGFNELLERNWIGKDESNHWWFFRGLNFVHHVENWKYRRSAIMYKEDLFSLKAFFIGTFLSSLCKSGNGESKTERTNRRSQHPYSPVSLSFIAKALHVSQSTAYRYRKLAQKYQYIRMEPNLKEVTNLTSNDVRLLKLNEVDSVRVTFGILERTNIQTKQLRIRRGKVFAQFPNLIFPQIALKKRTLRKYKHH
jgi:hypothetical protein